MYDKVKKPTWQQFYKELFNKPYEAIEQEYFYRADKVGLTDKAKSYHEKYRQMSLKQNLVINTAKGALEIPMRIPCDGEYVIIDACNAIMGMETFADISAYDFENIDLSNDEKLSKINEFAFHVGAELANIFGNDFADLTYTGKGLHFYKYCFTIGHRDAILGKVCFGGQNGTVLVMISGTGCAYADMYWEYKYYDFLTNEAKRAKLTRIDMAHDDFNGAYSGAEIANLADSQGMFALTNKMPSVQHLGDWKRHSGKGRTLQIGKRENGKLYRGYEKGKQLGDSDSLWFRSEVEFGNAGKHLEFEMLIHPTEYFAGAYPYCLELVEHAHGDVFTSVSRVPCIQKESEIALDKSISIWKRQVGRYIATYRQIFVKDDGNGNLISDDTKILDLIMTDKKDFYPKRLKDIQKYLNNPPSYASWAKNNTSDYVPYV